MTARHSLVDARTDGWLTTFQRSVPLETYSALSSAIGTRMFAFSVVLGWRVTALELGPSPDTTTVTYVIGEGFAPWMSPLRDFWRSITSALTDEESRAPLPESAIDVAALQGHLGARLMLLAPLFGIELRELVVEADASLVVFVRDGFEETMPVERLAAGIRSLVEQEHEKTLTVPAEDRLRALGQQARALQAAGKYAQAEPILKEMIGAWREIYGEDNVEVVNDRMNLAVSYRRRGEPERALPLLERVSEQLLFCADDDWRNLRLTALNNLAIAYHGIGKLPEAIAVLERSLRALGEGPRSPHRARVLDHLAMTCCDAGDLAKSESWARKGLDEWRGLDPSPPGDVAVSMSHLGKALVLQGKLTEAREVIEGSHRMMVESFGPEHPELAASFNLRGTLELAAQQPAAARGHFDRALAMTRGHLPDHHPIVADARLGSERCTAALS